MHEYIDIRKLNAARLKSAVTFTYCVDEENHDNLISTFLNKDRNVQSTTIDCISLLKPLDAFYQLGTTIYRLVGYYELIFVESLNYIMHNAYNEDEQQIVYEFAQEWSANLNGSKFIFILNIQS